MTKVFSYLEKLGIDPRMTKFSERKQLQKLGYLMQAWHLDVDFRFTWYIHGPYSPKLTRILYDSIDKKDVKVDGLTASELKSVEEFKEFLGSDLTDSDKLELLASIHFLKSKADAVGAPKDDVLMVLKEKKPYFSDEEIEEYWKKAERLDQLTRHN
jgi:uncharacterized protein YwgA